MEKYALPPYREMSAGARHYVKYAELTMEWLQ